MKKIALISAIMALSATQTAMAADGVINFTGNITDTACKVDVSSATQTVDLGTVSKSVFGSNGATAAAKRFNILLNDCPAGVSSAVVRFDGNTNSSNPSILALNAGSTASNVGVALYEQDSNTLISLGTNSASVNLAPDVTNTLTYFAKYMATGSVTSGTANSNASFTVTYQ